MAPTNVIINRLLASAAGGEQSGSLSKSEAMAQQGEFSESSFDIEGTAAATGGDTPHTKLLESATPPTAASASSTTAGGAGRGSKTAVAEAGGHLYPQHNPNTNPVLRLG